MRPDVFDAFLGKVVICKPKTSKSFTAKLTERYDDVLMFESITGIIGLTACDSVENMVELRKGETKW